MTNTNPYDKDLINVLAHDLRTPINSVRGFIEVASFSGPLSDRQKQMLDRAMSALDRMESLISDVLELSQVDSDMPMSVTECDMRHIVGESVSMMEGAAEAKQVSIDLDMPTNLPMLHADENRIKQVVNNLVGNAIKYNRDEGQVWIRVTTPEDKLNLEVEDTGFGIAEEDLPLIFDRFYRTTLGARKRISGSGLGLAIVKTIVEQHGGKISVQSEVDKGSIFTVILPLNGA
jgi:two-component system phosphate regulon sensor histidine kinase PhoR